jgi:hypothetical protein
MRLVIEIQKRKLVLWPVFDGTAQGIRADVPPVTVRYRRSFRGVSYVDLVKAARAAGPGGIVEISEKQLPLSA